MITALIFDLDDCLYPEKEFVQSGFASVSHAMFHILGIDEQILYYQLIREFNSGSRGNIFNIVLQKNKLEFSNKLISEMVSIYRNHEPVIKPYHDVSTCLLSLKKKYKLGLITDGYSAVQKKKIKALGIEHFFESLVYSDDLDNNNWKPSPLPYQVVLEQLLIKADEAIYIGDNPHKDFISARKLGLLTVRIRREGGEYSQIRLEEMFEANYEVSNMYELVTLLDRIV